MKHKRLAIVLTAVLLSAIASLSISSPAAFAYEEKCGISENESLETAATTYTVQKGDSLWKIAVKYEVGISELIAANPQIANPALIYPGQKISIPNAAPLKSIEDEIVRLVNIERSKNGLAPLTSNWQAARCARIKSQEMTDKNYFSHTSPTYGSPFKMMESFGLRFSAAAENIAYGQRTAQEVMNSWMNSPGHRANILSKSYTQIGVGVAKKSNGTLYFTQMFLKPY
jgi:uncharacterized YkwD family protein/spore coat assembly protein SafA